MSEWRNRIQVGNEDGTTTRGDDSTIPLMGYVQVALMTVSLSVDGREIPLLVGMLGCGNLDMLTVLFLRRYFRRLGLTLW